MKKHKAPQTEINWGEPEDFALIQEQGIDFDRIKAEQEQRERDRVESQSKQLRFEKPPRLTPPHFQGMGE